MLVFQLDNPNPTTREGITCFRCDSTIEVNDPILEIDFCFCTFECEEDLLVFAGNVEREKDYFTLYYKSKDESAEISFFIDETELEDGTHGRSIPNGFIVDFTKIFNEIGPGSYRLKIDVSGEFGVDFELTWGKFKVVPFDISRADGTVKIESIQSGNIESGFDFENENVPFYIRIPALFGNMQKVDELKSNPGSRRQEIQVHDRWWYEYDLEFNTNKYDFVRLILDNMIAGTEVFISDYNLMNMTREKPFNMVQVRQVETETEHIKLSNTTNYVIKFEDAIKNNVKHPYIDPC